MTDYTLPTFLSCPGWDESRTTTAVHVRRKTEDMAAGLRCTRSCLNPTNETTDRVDTRKTDAAIEAAPPYLSGWPGAGVMNTLWALYFIYAVFNARHSLMLGIRYVRARSLNG